MLLLVTITNPSGTIRLGIFGNNDWLNTSKW